MTQEEFKRQTEREIRWRIFFHFLPWMVIVLILGIGLLKDCTRTRGPIVDSF